MTLVLAEFGKILADAAKANDFVFLARALSLVEICMTDEPLIRDAVATGQLESLMSEALAQRLEFSLVARCLGEKSRAFCREWDAFTGVKTPGL